MLDDVDVEPAVVGRDERLRRGHEHDESRREATAPGRRPRTTAFPQALDADEVERAAGGDEQRGCRRERPRGEELGDQRARARGSR